MIPAMVCISTPTQFQMTLAIWSSLPLVSRGMVGDMWITLIIWSPGATAAVITIIDSLDSFGKSSPFTISGPRKSRFPSNYAFWFIYFIHAAGVQNCIPVVSTTSLLPPPPISTPPPSLSSTPTRTSSGSIATYTPIFPPSPSPGTKNSSVTADDPRVVLHGQAWRTSTTNCSSSGSKVSKQCTDRGLSLNFTFDGELVY